MKRFGSRRPLGSAELIKVDYSQLVAISFNSTIMILF